VIRIIKTTQLSQAELSEVSELVILSEKTDVFSTHFYWNSMSSRDNVSITDYLLYFNNQLVSCLSFFMFGENFVEICALTHPEHRRKGYFTRLFGEAQIELSLLQLDYCVFCCPKESFYAKKLLKRYQAIYQSSETNFAIDRETYFKLHAPDSDSNLKTALVKMQKAKKSDQEILAKLGAEAFESDYQEELERISKILEDKVRSAFLAYLGPKTNLKNPIGKAHIIKSNGIAIIHDFCLLSESSESEKKDKDKDKEKGKNQIKESMLLAHEFLNQLLAYLFQLKTQPVQQVKTLVGSSEIIEMKLYKNTGFQIVSTLEYWRCNFLPGEAYPSTALH